MRVWLSSWGSLGMSAREIRACRSCSLKLLTEYYFYKPTTDCCTKIKIKWSFDNLAAPFISVWLMISLTMRTSMVTFSWAICSSSCYWTGHGRTVLDFDLPQSAPCTPWKHHLSWGQRSTTALWIGRTGLTHHPPQRWSEENKFSHDGIILLKALASLKIVNVIFVLNIYFGKFCYI